MAAVRAVVVPSCLFDVVTRRVSAYSREMNFAPSTNVSANAKCRKLQIGLGCVELKTDTNDAMAIQLVTI